MNYEGFFADAIAGLKAEGRYRIFADLERCAGAFPRARRHGPNGVEDVTVWCSNDYLGMGQNPVVMDAMREARALQVVFRQMRAPKRQHRADKGDGQQPAEGQCQFGQVTQFYTRSVKPPGGA